MDFQASPNHLPVTRPLSEGLLSEKAKQRLTTGVLALGTAASIGLLGYSKVLDGVTPDSFVALENPKAAFFLGAALAGVGLTLFSSVDPDYSAEIRQAPLKVAKKAAAAILHQSPIQNLLFALKRRSIVNSEISVRIGQVSDRKQDRDCVIVTMPPPSRAQRFIHFLISNKNR